MPLMKSKTKPKHSLQFEALGTPWSIESNTVISRQLESLVHMTIDQFDATWSRFRSDSMVTRMSVSAGIYPLDPIGVKLFGWYERLYEMTGGRVTPLIGQTVADSGYDHRYHLRAQDTITQTPTWDDRIILEESTLHIKKPCLIDVGAAGKGLAVDTVVNLMKQHGHDKVTVDASGDIYTSNLETIGLEHPFDPSKIIGTVNVQNKSICGSASNKRAWGNGLHHIVDPNTSRPTDDIIATWAIADTAMQADGLATALFFISPDTLQQYTSFDYIVVHKNGQIAYSKHKDITVFI